jgi:hypothetical protein
MSLLSSSQGVVVTTPEKIDLLFRTNSEWFSTVRLVVIDEAHNLKEAGRHPSGARAGFFASSPKWREFAPLLSFGLRTKHRPSRILKINSPGRVSTPRDKVSCDGFTEVGGIPPSCGISLSSLRAGPKIFLRSGSRPYEKTSSSGTELVGPPKDFWKTGQNDHTQGPVRTAVLGSEGFSTLGYAYPSLRARHGRVGWLRPVGRKVPSEKAPQFPESAARLLHGFGQEVALLG